ncbi:hypothetical protein ACFX19_032590 [Malus domestica]
MGTLRPRQKAFTQLLPGLPLTGKDPSSGPSRSIRMLHGVRIPVVQEWAGWGETLLGYSKLRAAPVLYSVKALLRPKSLRFAQRYRLVSSTDSIM